MVPEEIYPKTSFILKASLLKVICGVQEDFKMHLQNSFQVSLPQLLDQMDTELRLLREELRQHKMQQNGGADNPDPRPQYTDIDLTNGGYQQ